MAEIEEMESKKADERKERLMAEMEEMESQIATAARARAKKGDVGGAQQVVDVDDTKSQIAFAARAKVREARKAWNDFVPADIPNNRTSQQEDGGIFGSRPGELHRHARGRKNQG